MSNYEDSEADLDDQSEDGEIRNHPLKSVHPSDGLDDNISSLSSEGEEADTADSLDIRPPQALVHRKGRMPKRDKADRLEMAGGTRRPHKDSHRKSHHHRPREHHRSERHRDKRHHRDRREAKRGERERMERMGGGSRERGLPPPAVAPAVEDLRAHLERRTDKQERGDRRQGKEQQVERERRERIPEMIAPVREIRETPRERAERVEREHRRERLLLADREMVRQKEAYRRELEARRGRMTAREEQEAAMAARERSRSRERKRQRGEDQRPDAQEEENVHEAGEIDDDIQIVSETDDSDEEEEEGEEEEEEEQARQSAEEESHEESEAEGVEGEEDSSDSDSTASESGGSEEENGDQQLVQQGQQEENGEPGEMEEKIHEDISENESSPQDGENKAAAGTVTPPRSEEEGEEELELTPYLPAIQGCRSVEEFQCLNRIEEGTYGVVYRARDKRSDEIVALKRLKMEKEKEGFPITSLREINTLLKAQHPNIVTVREIVVGSNMDKIFIVMDYVEHDLKSLMETMKQKKQVFVPGEVKCLMQQLLRAVAHLHDNWILHRDLKTSNLLLSHKGVLKVGDFGLAREYGSPLKPYTPIVVTLWYRSPELLLGAKEYSTPVDMWSVGCIFGELLSMEALFPGKSEIDQLNKIFRDMGTPNEKIWPGYSKLPAVQKMNFAEYPINNLRARFATMLTEQGFDLMNQFLTFDPAMRISAEDALRHNYFRESPLAIDPAMFPTWPAKSELGHRKAAAASPKPPSGGKEYKQLGDADDDVTMAGSFHLGIFEHRRSAMGAGFSLKF